MKGTTMIDPFDYKEPQCPLCGGEEFYGAERRAQRADYEHYRKA